MGWGGMAAGDQGMREPWKTQSAESEVLYEQIDASPSLPFSISASPLAPACPVPPPRACPLPPPPSNQGLMRPVL